MLWSESPVLWVLPTVLILSVCDASNVSLRRRDIATGSGPHEETTPVLSSKSTLKFNGCSATTAYFSLCPESSSCDGECTDDRIEKDAYMNSDLWTFVNRFTEAQLDTKDYACEMVREACLMTAIDKEEDMKPCFENAGLDEEYCNEMNQQLNLQKWLTCSEWKHSDTNHNNDEEKDNFFVGPYCFEGHAIHLGLFLDEDCTTLVSNSDESDIYEREEKSGDVGGLSLLMKEYCATSGKPIVSKNLNNCVSCKSKQLEDVVNSKGSEEDLMGDLIRSGSDVLEQCSDLVETSLHIPSDAQKNTVSATDDEKLVPVDAIDGITQTIDYAAAKETQSKQSLSWRDKQSTSRSSLPPLPSFPRTFQKDTAAMASPRSLPTASLNVAEHDEDSRDQRGGKYTDDSDANLNHEENGGISDDADADRCDPVNGSASSETAASEDEDWDEAENLNEEKSQSKYERTKKVRKLQEQNQDTNIQEGEDDEFVELDSDRSFYIDFCRTDGTSHETIAVFFLLTWLHIRMYPDDIQGNCCDVIADICVENADCYNDQCNCSEGFEGDGSILCCDTSVGGVYVPPFRGDDATCSLLDVEEVEFLEQVVDTDLESIEDYIVDGSDEAVPEIQSFLALVRERIPVELSPPPTDRDILAVVMTRTTPVVSSEPSSDPSASQSKAPSAVPSVAPSQSEYPSLLPSYSLSPSSALGRIRERRELVSFTLEDLAGVERRLQDGISTTCAASAINLLLATIDLLLSLFGLRGVASAFANKVVELILLRNPGTTVLLIAIIRSLRRGPRNVQVYDQLFTGVVGLLANVGVGTLLDALRDSLSFTGFLTASVILAAEMAALFLTGGAYFFAKLAIASFSLLQLFLAGETALNDCCCSGDEVCTASVDLPVIDRECAGTTECCGPEPTPPPVSLPPTRSPPTEPPVTPPPTPSPPPSPGPTSECGATPPNRCCSDGTQSIPGTGGRCPCSLPDGDYCIEGKVCCPDGLFDACKDECDPTPAPSETPTTPAPTTPETPAPTPPECEEGESECGASCCSPEQQCCNGSCISQDACCEGTPCGDMCCAIGSSCCGGSCCSGSCCEGSCRDDCGDDDAMVAGDPHIITFDNLRYECQGEGEFVMLRSLDSALVLQSRFKKTSTRVSVNRGFVAQVTSTSPVVQLAIPENDGDPILYVDSEPRDASLSFEDDEIRFSPTGLNYVVEFKQPSLKIQVRKRGDRLDFRRVSLSKVFRSERVVGLLGKVDDESTNDWMLSNGTTIPLPDDYRSGSTPYDYCTVNWCISDEAESLFVYDQGLDFDYYFGCNQPFGGVVDLNSANPQLRALCGIDEECLTDGIEIGLEAAQSVLENKAQVLRASSEAQFRLFPSVLVENAYYNITFTVNMSLVAPMIATSIEGYSIYRLRDSSSAILLVAALDDGNDADSVQDDLVFTGAAPLRSTVAGESIDFQAVPIIGGNEDSSSEYVFTRLNGAVCFSSESEIGTTELVVLSTQSYPANLRFRIFSGPNLFSDRTLAANSADIFRTRVALSVNKVDMLESRATLTRPVNCFTGSCRLQEITAILEVDLAQLPTNVRVRLGFEGPFSEFRRYNSAGGSLRKYKILALQSVTVSLYEVYSGSVPEYHVNNVDCSSGICTAGSVHNEITMDLSGLPPTVDVYLDSSVQRGGIVRRILDQGGSNRNYSVLPWVFDVRFVDSNAVLVAESIDCTLGSTSCTVPGPLSAVLTVDLTGLPAAVRARLGSNNALTEFRRENNAGGSVKQYGILALSKVTVSLYEAYSGSVSEYRVHNIDCTSGECDAGDITNELTIDLTGLPPSMDVYFDVEAEGGGVVRRVLDQGGVSRTYTVLPWIYDLRLVDSRAVLTIEGVDCRAGSSLCTVSDTVAAVLSVDLSGLPSAIRVSLGVESSLTNFRTLPSDGGSLRTYEVLALPRISVSLYEVYTGTVQEYQVDEIDCTSGTCSAGNVTNEISMDLTGLPTSVDVFLDSPIDGGGTVRRLLNRGGTDQTYFVLPWIYDIRVVDSAAVLLIERVDCSLGSSSCSLPNSVAALLEVDLIGLPRNVRLRLGVESPLVSFRSLSNAGDTLQTLEILALPSVTVSLYEVYSGNVEEYHVNGIDCTSGSCSVERSTNQLAMNLTGIPTTVDVYLDSPVEGGGTVRRILDQGGTSQVYTVLPLVYDVRLVDSAATLVAQSIDCSLDSCSFSQAIAALLEVDLFGLPANVRVRLGVESDIANFRTVSNEGGAARAYEILALPSITVSLYEAYSGSVEEFHVTGIDCTSGSCNAGIVTKKLSIDLAGLPTSVDIYLDNPVQGGGTIRRILDQGGTFKAYTVLPWIYDVRIVDQSATLVAESVDCSLGSSACNIGGVSALLEVNLRGLPTAVQTQLGAGSQFNTFRTTSNSGGVLQQFSLLALPSVSVSLYEVYSGSVEQYHINDIDCSSGTCTVGDVTSDLTVDLTGLPATADVYLRDPATGGTVRRVNDQGGSLETYTVICGRSYRLDVYDGSSLLLSVPALNCVCGSTCDTSGESPTASPSATPAPTTASQLSLNLTGLPSSLDVALDAPSQGGVNVYGFRNQGGSARLYTVLPRLYDIRLIDEAAVLISQSVDCTVGSASCAIDSTVAASLDVDLRGLPRSVRVRLGVESALSTFRTQTFAGSVLRTYEVLALPRITVSLFERYSGSVPEYRVNNIDCTAGTCSAGNVTSQLGVDLMDLPVSVDIYLYNPVAAGGLIRRIFDQGGAAQTYAVLPLTYDIRVYDSAAFLVVESVDCSSGLCSAPGPLAAALNVNLTGLPLNVRVRLGFESALTNFRTLSNAGGSVRSYEILALPRVTVSLYEFDSGTVQEYRVNDIDCSSGVCSAGNVTSQLQVDLTGVPSTVDLYLDNPVIGGGVIRRINNQGGAPRTYTVLPLTYDIRIYDGSAFLKVKSVECSSGSCSVAALAATLEVDLTGLPIGVRVRLGFAGSLTNFRTLSNAGGSLKVYNILALPRVTVSLYEVYSGTVEEYRVNDIDCSSGTCSAGNVTRQLAVDLTGLPVSVYLFLDSPVAGGGVIRRIPNQGGAARTYTVLPRTYDVRVYDSNALLRFDSVDCSLGSCALPGPLAATLEVDLTGLPLGIRVRLGFESALTNFRTLSNAGGSLNSYKILALPRVTVSLYEVYTGTVQEYHINDIDCTSGTCTTGDVMAELSMDLTGLPVSLDVYLLAPPTEGGGFVRLISDQGGVSRTYAVLRRVYDVILQDSNAQQKIESVDCSEGSCTVPSPLSATLEVNLTGLPIGVRVRLGVESALNNFRTLTNAGGRVQQYNVLPLPRITVSLYDRERDTVTEFHVDGIDCTSGSCSAGDLTSQLSVDLRGFPVSSDVLLFAVPLDGGGRVRAIADQGGIVRAYTVICGRGYRVEVRDTTGLISQASFDDCVCGGVCTIMDE